MKEIAEKGRRLPDCVNSGSKSVYSAAVFVCPNLLAFPRERARPNVLTCPNGSICANVFCFLNEPRRPTSTCLKPGRVCCL